MTTNVLNIITETTSLDLIVVPEAKAIAILIQDQDQDLNLISTSEITQMLRLT
ncbi:hypothetical protein [Paenisporosarcina indica]|uniref:hypothetical protein n=1 Tax=Paenisporosarcina indica TaxID=650093 RepID=UPI00137360E1|nr:hypothetical protein [Paenisporosarcina indica]